jgi:hypothetical protein
MNRLLLMLLMILMAAFPGRGIAAAQPDLSDVTLLTTGGAPFATDQIGRDREVLLVLISKGNPGGIQLLDYLEGLKPQIPAGQLMIVFSGADEMVVQSVSAGHSKLEATWYRDPQGTLAKKLKLATTPVVMGVRNARVAWNMFGVSNPELLEKSMRGWLNR